VKRARKIVIVSQDQQKRIICCADQIRMLSTALRQTALVIGAANSVGFALSATFHTHILTDLVGVGSFVLATLRLSSLQQFQSLLTTIPWYDNRLLLINAAVGLWGARLASYLFHRILYIKEDKRLAKFYPQPDEPFFDKKRSNFPINLAYFWSIQALWGFICMLPVTLLNGLILATPSTTTTTITPLLSISQSGDMIANIISKYLPLNNPNIISHNMSTFVYNLLRTTGRVLVIIPFMTLFLGIIMETIADYQKYQYKSNPQHANHWCDIGLWSLCRYPNCKFYVTIIVIIFSY
jgi:steroid 5-alpha reductase family enzyme